MAICSGCKKVAGRSVLIIGDTKIPYCNECIKAWEFIIKETKVIKPVKGKPQGRISTVRIDVKKEK